MNVGRESSMPSREENRCDLHRALIFPSAAVDLSDFCSCAPAFFVLFAISTVVCNS